MPSMRSRRRSGCIVLCYAGFFSTFAAMFLSPTFAHSAIAGVIRCVFAAAGGSVVVAVSVAAIRSGSITVGRGRPITYTRTERPVDFWGLTLWFLIFGFFFATVGIGSLIYVAVATYRDHRPFF